MLSPCGNADGITVQLEDDEGYYIVTIVKQA